MKGHLNKGLISVARWWTLSGMTAQYALIAVFSRVYNPLISVLLLIPTVVAFMWINREMGRGRFQLFCQAITMPICLVSFPQSTLFGISRFSQDGSQEDVGNKPARFQAIAQAISE